jgi:hypothetical protein
MNGVASMRPRAGGITSLNLLIVVTCPLARNGVFHAVGNVV